jgi:dihydrolipoamide dehydrogenase
MSPAFPASTVAFDEKVVVTRPPARWTWTKVPGHLVVVGGGVIGLELGSVWARLGAKVTVVEYLDAILGGMDGEVAKQFQKPAGQAGHRVQARRQGDRRSRRRRRARPSPSSPPRAVTAETIAADAVLVARPGASRSRTALGLAEGGRRARRARPRQRSTIPTGCTNVPGVYAIGDVVRGADAGAQGRGRGRGGGRDHRRPGRARELRRHSRASSTRARKSPPSARPRKQLKKAERIAYTAGKFPFSANGRARAMLQTDGFVKILADKATDRVLGVHIVGFGAGEMIHEAAVLMEFGGSSEDLARTCHAHPDDVGGGEGGGAGDLRSSRSTCRLGVIAEHRRAWPIRPRPFDMLQSFVLFVSYRRYE